MSKRVPKTKTPVRVTSPKLTPRERIAAYAASVALKPPKPFKLRGFGR